MSETDFETSQIEAAVFRRLVQHLMRERADVQNIDLMILAGFCRNCLADWYREAADQRGITMTRDESRPGSHASTFTTFTRGRCGWRATSISAASYSTRRHPPQSLLSC